MYLPPNPKKVAFDRSVREREALKLAQIETCYGKYKPGQEKFVIFNEIEAARERIRQEQIEQEIYDEEMFLVTHA